MKMRSLLLGLAGAVACGAIAVAAGLWPNLPIVGGARYCATYSTGPSGQNCTLYVPAGPSALEGTETIPADTNYSQGRAPQSVKLTLAAINAAPVRPVAGSSVANNTVTAGVQDGGVILTGSGALSPVTLTLPPGAQDRQRYYFTANQNIASLTVQGAGSDTVDNAPTALSTSTTAVYGYLFQYSKSATKWYRLQ